MGGTVEYLIVMQEGARAHLVAEGSDRMEDLGSRTAQEGLDDHLNFAERFEEDWRRILEEDLRRIEEDPGRLDVLVNNAAILYDTWQRTERAEYAR